MTIDYIYFKYTLLNKISILPLMIPGILMSILILIVNINFYPYIFVIGISIIIKFYPYLIKKYPFQKSMLIGLVFDIGIGYLLLYYHPVWLWIVVGVLVIFMIIFKALLDTVAYSQLSNNFDNNN